MVNKSKVRGTSWETAIVNYLKTIAWPYCRRLVLAGSKDLGDISLGDTPTGGPITIEAKDHAKIDLAGFIRELEEECANAGHDYGVVIIKRRGKGVNKAYVVTTLEMWAKDRARMDI